MARSAVDGGTTVMSVRCSTGEWERWGVVAGAAGLSRNAWLRRAANEAAALEAALGRERVRREVLPVYPGPVASPESHGRVFRGPDPKPGRRR